LIQTLNAPAILRLPSIVRPSHYLEAKGILEATRLRYPDSRFAYAMPQQLANYAQTQLALALTNGAGPIVASVVSVAGWATIGNFRLRIDDLAPLTTYEIVEVTAVNVGANQVTIGTRGLEGTTAIAHGAGAKVGNPITAAMLLAMMPLGTLGYNEALVNQGGITAQVDLTSLAITPTIGTGRRVRIEGLGLFTSSIAGDTANLYIMEGATQLGVFQVNLPTTATGFTLHGSVVLTPTPGAHPYKLQASRGAGTGTLVLNSGGTEKAYILCEDIGT
jgi:hypothetical protein